MKKVFGCLILAWVVSLGSVAIGAGGSGSLPVLMHEGQAPAELPDTALQRISLNLRNIDIQEALKFFSMKTGINIVPTQRVAGRVTLSVENAIAKDVFDVMLRSNNLAYDYRGDIYNVMTEEEYKQIYGKKFVDMRVVKVFRLKYAVPAQAFTLLEALKSEIGRLLVDPESGSVMIIDTPEKIIEAQKALESLEQKNVVKVFVLKYAKAKDVEAQLQMHLDKKGVGMTKADERSNQIIVQTLPERMDNIEKLILSLDKKTKAVLIDTKIIKIYLSNQNDSGVQWEGLMSLAQKAGMAYVGSYPFSVIQAATESFLTRNQYYKNLGEVGSYPFSGNTDTTNTGTKSIIGKNMHVGIISGKRDIDLLINYVQTLGKSKIIASPSLSVVNNQEAKIHIGERRAYVTTTTTKGSSTNTVSEAVTYVDVGVALTLTPTINDDGYVTLRIKPEISSIIGNVVSSSNNLIPIIDTNTADTTVLAKDGTTILIGGLGRDEITESTEQVPFLGNIPFLGAAFRNKTKKTQHVELIIMLTPTILDGDKFVDPREQDKIPVKPAKQFDVFRPEIMPPAEPTVFIPLNLDFPSKNFKPYSAQGMYSSRTAQEGSAEISDSDKLMARDLKPYGQTDVSVTRETQSALVKKEEIATKGFQSYN